MFPSNHLTPNYQAFQHKPALYAAALPFVIGDHARSLVATRSTYKPVSLDLSMLSTHLDRVAEEVATIIAANKVALDRSDTDAYLDARGWALAETYTRDMELFEGGHLTAIEATLVSAILERVQSNRSWLEAANFRGLALLDIHLRDAARCIEALLARQVCMFDEVSS